MNYNYPPPPSSHTNTCRIIKYAFSIFLLFITSFTSGLLAQTDQPLFSVRVDLPSQVLSIEDLTKLASLETNSKFKSITPILIGDLPTLQRNGEVSIQLPGKASALVFSTTEVISDVNGNFEWYGRVIDRPGSYAVLLREDGETFGLMVVDSKSYLIQSLADGYSLLLEEDMDRFPTEGCALIEGHEGSGKKPHLDLKDAADCDPQTVVRISVFYTAAAAAQQANMSQYVGTQVAAANNTLFNSDINFNDLRFETAGVREIVGYTEQPNILDEIDELQLLGETQGSFVQQQRDALEGDLVILLTDGVYGAAGVAFQQVGDESLAYGVVQVDFPTSRNTFAHEIGHMLGARHDTDAGAVLPPGSGNIGIFAAGRRFFANGNEEWTTMAEIPLNNIRLPNFSNPNVDFEGTPTGVVNVRDNTRQIRDNGACEVSCYRPPFQPDMEVVITGFNQSPPGTTNTWCTDVSNCNNVTDFDWEYSYDGFNFTSFFGGSCATRTMPNNVNTVWLRVTVTCSDGQMDTDVHRINVGSAGGGGGGGPVPLTSGGDIENRLYSKEADLKAIVYPNPASGEINLQYTLNTPETTRVEVRSRSGEKVISSFLMQQDAGTHSLRIQEDLSPGIYFLHLRTDEASAIKKVIVL